MASSSVLSVFSRSNLSVRSGNNNWTRACKFFVNLTKRPIKARNLDRNFNGILSILQDLASHLGFLQLLWRSEQASFLRTGCISNIKRPFLFTLSTYTYLFTLFSVAKPVSSTFSERRRTRNIQWGPGDHVHAAAGCRGTVQYNLHILQAPFGYEVLSIYFKAHGVKLRWEKQPVTRTWALSLQTGGIFVRR